MKKKIIIIFSFLCFLGLIFFTMLLRNDDDKYPKHLKIELEVLENEDKLIEINQEYIFGNKKILIYGVAFESGDRSKPVIYYHAFNDSGNTSLSCTDPPITGGGGTVGKEICNTTRQVEDSITFQVVFTQPVRKEYTITLNL